MNLRLTNTLLYAKQITNKDLLYSTGNYTQDFIIRCEGKEYIYMDFPGSSNSKVSAYSVGDPASKPESGRSPGEGNGNPLQYSCLENPMDRGAW